MSPLAVATATGAASPFAALLAVAPPPLLQDVPAYAREFVEHALTLGGSALAGAPISSLFLSFLFYGFIGWAWESTVCAYAEYTRFANSGFLLGPCCPIYGVGALVCWLALRGIPDTLVLFLAAMLVCSAIEYAVGCLLERLTGARFWDYSGLPLNIHGRVCLYGALLFGSASVLVCRMTEPWLLWVMAQLPNQVVIGAAIACAILLSMDTVFAVASWRRLSSRLETLRAGIAEQLNDGLGDISDKLIESIPAEVVDAGAAVQVRTRALNGWLLTISDAVLDALRSYRRVPSIVFDGRRGLKTAMGAAEEAADRLKLSLDRRDLRFFNAFPHLRMPSYEGVLRATRLKERARELFRR